MSTCGNIKDRVTDAIAEVVTAMEQSYTITLDQVDDLVSLKDELEETQHNLDDASRKLDEIESILYNSEDVLSNADSMRQHSLNRSTT